MTDGQNMEIQDEADKLEPEHVPFDIHTLASGEIEVESTPGKGSVSHVRLELSKPVVKEALMKNAFKSLCGLRILAADRCSRRRTIGRRYLEQNGCRAYEPPEDGKDVLKMPGEGMKSGKPQILLVEDILSNQRLAEVMLKHMGCSSDIAENGRQAVIMCGSGKYDIILMDCHMPVMDGYEASSAIRLAGGINSKTPIIAMTANACEEERIKCMSAGMDDYISKPVTMGKLNRVITEWRYKSSIGAVGMCSLLEGME